MSDKDSELGDRESRRWQEEKQRKRKRCASCSLYKYIYFVCRALVVGGLYSWNATLLVFRSVFSKGRGVKFRREECLSMDCRQTVVCNISRTVRRLLTQFTRTKELQRSLHFRITSMCSRLQAIACKISFLISTGNKLPSILPMPCRNQFIPMLTEYPILMLYVHIK